jgi:hypothetical protein
MSEWKQEDLILSEENVLRKFQNAVDELAAKGETADDIAKALIEDGCQTHTAMSTCMCPVGRWIWHRIPWKYSKGFSFQVGRLGVGEGYRQQLTFPEQIQNFIKGFDTGSYKQLWTTKVCVPD